MVPLWQTSTIRGALAHGYLNSDEYARILFASLPITQFLIGSPRDYLNSERVACFHEAFSAIVMGPKDRAATFEVRNKILIIIQAPLYFENIKEAGDHVLRE